MSILRALLFAVAAFVDIASCSQSFINQQKFVYDKNTPGLYIYAFNTGQANCIVMRHGNNSYIVDAGCQSLPKDFDANLRKMLTGTTLKYVFITHPHTDHYNLLNAVLGTFNEKQTQPPAFYLGGYLKHYPQDLSINSGKTVYVSPLQSVEVPGIDGLSFKIIPSSVQQKTSDKNTYSYMLLVTYKERNILFGGDYILKAQNIEQVKKLLPQKLDVVFLPHHGSVRTKSETLIKEISYALNESGTEYVEEKCDVSDDDAVSALPHVEQEGERQCLFFICGGTNSNVKNAPIFDNLLAARGTIKPHNICLRDLKGPVGADDTTRPLFTTQGAEYGFYGIRINQMDGSIEMCGINGTEWDTPFTKTVGKRKTEMHRPASLLHQNGGNKRRLNLKVRHSLSKGKKARMRPSKKASVRNGVAKKAWRQFLKSANAKKNVAGRNNEIKQDVWRKMSSSKMRVKQDGDSYDGGK